MNSEVMGFELARPSVDRLCFARRVAYNYNVGPQRLVRLTRRPCFYATFGDQVLYQTFGFSLGGS